MEMNLKSLREEVFDRAEWSPTPTQEAVDRVNGFINAAVLDLARDCPFAMNEKDVMLFTQPVVEPLDATDTVEVVEWDALGDSQEIWGGAQTPVNPWVFKATLAPGSGTAWQVNRQWDGRLIEIIATDGTIYRNQIRTVWRDTGAASEIDEYRFSVVHPFHHEPAGTGPFSWRILAGQHYLPNDCIRPKYLRLLDPTYTRTIEFFTREQAQRMNLNNRFAESSPVIAVRHPPMVMKGPTVAPDVADGGGDWLGPEPPGQFKYRITYTWGKQDGETQGPGMGLFQGEVGNYQTSNRTMPAEAYSENRMKLPKWESPASLESDAVTATPAAEDGQANDIKLTLPNIEYALGFLISGTNRSAGPTDLDFRRANVGRSGWHVAIYRKRITADFTKYNTAPTSGSKNLAQIQKLEESADYYLIAEMRIDENNNGEWTDDGTHLPDYNRPLRSTGTHLGFELYPAPEARYPMKLTYFPTPRTLVDDTDVPAALMNAREALIERALYYTLRMTGDPRANESRSRYEEEVRAISDEMGSAVPEAQVMRKRAARAGRGRHNYRARWGRTEV